MLERRRAAAAKLQDLSAAGDLVLVAALGTLAMHLGLTPRQRAA